MVAVDVPYTKYNIQTKHIIMCHTPYPRWKTKVMVLCQNQCMIGFRKWSRIHSIDRLTTR